MNPRAVHHLTTYRYMSLMNGAELLDTERKAGWHWCPDADGRLAGQSDGSPGDWRYECHRDWEGCKCGVRNRADR